jgi:ATP-binding cassette, subfamily B, bacterial
LRKPAILVFDEATSSLDSESEQHIQEAIWRLSKEYTIIIIAHRLSTILKADNVLVMEQGRVEAFGPMHDMSRKNPLFKRMLKLQNIGEIRV